MSEGYTYSSISPNYFTNRDSLQTVLKRGEDPSRVDLNSPLYVFKKINVNGVIANFVKVNITKISENSYRIIPFNETDKRYEGVRQMVTELPMLYKYQLQNKNISEETKTPDRGGKRYRKSKKARKSKKTKRTRRRTRKH
jgi:hypothetical protein